MDLRATLRRSVLSVPATDVSMMARGLASQADTVFFDLEDSVPVEEKERARRNVVELAPGKPAGLSLGLRVNDWSTRWCYRDLIEVVGVVGEHLDYIVLPKAVGPIDVAAVAGLLDQIEQDAGIGHRVLIEPIIESGAGLLDARAIASASDRVFSVVFAPEGLDFAADMHFYDGVDPGYLNASALLPLAAARACGVQLIDGPYVALYDTAGLRRTAAQRFRMGFDGKWAIHPDQVAVINEEFTPSAHVLATANQTVSTFADAARRGRGAAVMDQTMVDVASDRVARVALERSAMVAARSEEKA